MCSGQATCQSSDFKNVSLLQLQGDAVPSPLLSDLRHMTNLQGLSLKESSYCSESDKLSPGIIESLSGCLSLRSLDLSYTDIPIKVVSFSKEHTHCFCLSNS